MAIMTDLKDTPLAKLSLKEIAAALIMLIPNCVMLGHQSIPSTLEYVHPPDGGPAAFVSDLFTLKPEEVAEKWYGGEKRAALLSARASSLALFGDLDDEPAT